MNFSNAHCIMRGECAFVKSLERSMLFLKKEDDTYNLKSMCNDSDGHELLAVIASVHHHRVCQALNDWALRFSKPLDSISTSGVRCVDGCSDLYIITAVDTC